MVRGFDVCLFVCLFLPLDWIERGVVELALRKGLMGGTYIYLGGVGTWVGRLIMVDMLVNG